jgi:ribosomal-protein-alanine N-acetyltransferase
LPAVAGDISYCSRMAIATKNLTLIPHVPAVLLALLQDSDAYQKISGMQVADGVRDFLLTASADFQKQLQTATSPDPWRFGFAIVHTAENIVIGMCGFTGPPTPGGAVEIAYSIAPGYEGKGYATEAAAALIDYACKNGRVRTIRADTLPETNASTRVLQKCGFKKVGEIVDPENNLIWRWERSAQ